MIEIAEIKDRESLKQWLTDWPKENGLDEDAGRAVAVAIAHRAAMRVLPVWWDWTLSEAAHKRDLLALAVLRCNLISGVAGKMPTPLIMAASGTGHLVGNAANVAVDFVADAAAAAAYACISPGVAEFAADAASTATAGTPAEAAFVAANAALWNEIRTDCRAIADSRIIMSAPLWAEPDAGLDKTWHDVKSGVTAPEWPFWIKWYDDALVGAPQNWKMLEQIALIETEVWEEGAEAVADAIAKIVEKFDLLDAVRSLKQARLPLFRSTASAAHRSHNQPPELIDMPAEIAREITFIWDNLDHAEKELEKSDPERTLLERTARAILRGLAKIVKYCAKVGDTVIMSGAVVVGAAGGGLVLDSYFNNGKVLDFANRLLQYATGG